MPHLPGARLWRSSCFRFFAGRRQGGSRDHVPVHRSLTSFFVIRNLYLIFGRNFKFLSPCMKIGLCSDHAGFGHKARIMAYLESKGIDTVDFGTHSTDSMDYPDVAHPLAEAVETGAVDKGIALCGTGNGMAITLNKHQKIRAGLAWNTEIGELVKRHNDANILVMPARFISCDEALKITDAWLGAGFEGGRHQRRIDKIPL